MRTEKAEREEIMEEIMSEYLMMLSSWSVPGEDMSGWGLLAYLGYLE